MPPRKSSRKSSRKLSKKSSKKSSRKLSKKSSRKSSRKSKPQTGIIRIQDINFQRSRVSTKQYIIPIVPQEYILQITRILTSPDDPDDPLDDSVLMFAKLWYFGDDDNIRGSVREYMGTNNIYNGKLGDVFFPIVVYFSKTLHTDNTYSQVVTYHNEVKFDSYLHNPDLYGKTDQLFTMFNGMTRYILKQMYDIAIRENLTVENNINIIRIDSRSDYFKDDALPYLQVGFTHYQTGTNILLGYNFQKLQSRVFPIPLEYNELDRYKERLRQEKEFNEMKAKEAEDRKKRLQILKNM